MSTITSAFLLVALTACPFSEKEAVNLARSSPEEQGISSEAILDFIETADKKIEVMNSFMLVRHGRVVAEGWWSPYDAKYRHELYSLSKSFTSTAVGMAVAEGKFSIDDPVLNFFPEDSPEQASNNLKSMRVRDLLCMSVGHQNEAQLMTSKETWTKTFLAHPVPHKPGGHFLYNTPATYMLSAIVQKATGQTVLDYLRPRLFEPLGIEDPVWGKSPQGISLGGYGLSVRTEDIARFGQLYLQKGRWNRQQLVPADWVEMATSKQTSNGSSPRSDWEQGYGFQFWRCRHGFYRGDGAFGQFCIVMPEKDAVVVITSGVRDMQAMMNLVWDKLVPAMKAGPLPDDLEGRRKLQKKLESLSIPALAETMRSTAATKVMGKMFDLPANEQKIEMIGLHSEKENNQVVLVMKCNGGAEQRILCGNGMWQKGRLALGPVADQPAAVCGAWTAEDAYELKICFYETPFIVTLKMKYFEDKLVLDIQRNVSFGPLKAKQLEGTVKKGGN